MAGLAGLTEAEKKIYDDFEAGGRALLAKAKADAAAIGADLTAIIGQTEAKVMKVEGWVSKAVKAAWAWLMSWTNFLDDKRGKFSYKRGSGVVALVTSLIFAFRGDWKLALVYFSGTVIIALWCAIEQK
jgi:hypothetical protein